MKKKKQINSYLVGDNEINKARKSDFSYSKNSDKYGVLHPLKACLNIGAYNEVGKKTAYKLNKGTFSNKVFII